MTGIAVELENELSTLMTEIDNSKAVSVLQRLVEEIIKSLETTGGGGEYRIGKISAKLLGKNSQNIEKTNMALTNVLDLSSKVICHAFVKATNEEQGFSVRNFKKVLEVRKYTALGSMVALQSAMTDVHL